MPVRLSDLYRPITCSLPQMGEVQIRNVSWKLLSDLLTTIGDTEDEGARAQFIDKLLSQMIAAPETDELEVSQPHSSDMAGLVDCAAAVMSLDEDLAEIDGELLPRERLYRAIENHRKVLNEQIVETVRKVSTGWGRMPTNLLGGAVLNPNILKPMMPKWTGTLDLLSQAGRPLKLTNLAPDLLPLGHQIRTMGDALAAANVPPDFWKDVSKSVAGLGLPEPYLSDSLRISGWNAPSIHTTSYEMPTVGTYESEEEIEDRTKDVGLERMIGAYDTLVQLEWLLRTFISRRLQEHAGDRWWKQRVPPEVRKESHSRKQQRETPDSLVHDPVDYLFVGEIRAIICRGENWRGCFAIPFDNDKGTVEVMFKWIEPVRKDIAHSRPVSDDEYTQFVMAAQWLTRKIRRVVE